MAHYSKRESRDGYRDHEDRPRYRKPRTVQNVQVPEDGTNVRAPQPVGSYDRAQELRERRERDEKEFRVAMVGDIEFLTDDGHFVTAKHPCEADNFADYVRLNKERMRYFNMAMRLNAQAMLDFREWDDHGRMRAERDSRTNWESYQQTLELYRNARKELRELRLKYEPLAVLREDLEKHDWYFRYSDDPSVYKNAKAREDELAKRVKELGPEAQAIWDEIAQENGRSKKDN